jgi:hypothetical protein
MNEYDVCEMTVHCSKCINGTYSSHRHISHFLVDGHVMDTCCLCRGVPCHRDNIHCVSREIVPLTHTCSTCLTVKDVLEFRAQKEHRVVKQCQLCRTRRASSRRRRQQTVRTARSTVPHWRTMFNLPRSAVNVNRRNDRDRRNRQRERHHHTHTTQNERRHNTTDTPITRNSLVQVEEHDHGFAVYFDY